jgi:hypothetical protein
MGDPPVGATLDRIDNEGGYSVENCRWAPPVEQNNNKRNNVVLAYNGRTMTLMEWSRHLGTNSYTLWSRLDRGWPIESVLSV